MLIYASLENTKNQHLFTTSHRKVAQEKFSGTSDVSYYSKPWRDWSGLSIAPTPDRIRRVEATNDANEDRSNPVSQSVPLKKKTHFCWLKLLPSKRSNFQLQKTYLSFLHTTHSFFCIFTFVPEVRQMPFRKFNVQIRKVILCCHLCYHHM